MKKLFCIATILGLAFCAACGDDHHKEQSCDASFVAHCEDGKYVTCDLRGKEGTVVRDRTVTQNDVEYLCNGKDILVPSGLYCEDGMIRDSNREDVAYDAYCDGDRVLRCDHNVIAEQDVCKSGFSCVEYERGSYVYAHCYEDAKVKTGCESGVTTYGSCSDSGVLKFCSNSDPKQGKTIELDCAADGMACRLIEKDGFGYDCTKTCTKDSQEFTEHGTCMGTRLLYCMQEGDNVVFDEVDCAEGDMTCGFDVYQFNCVSKKK